MNLFRLHLLLACLVFYANSNEESEKEWTDPADISSSVTSGTVTEGSIDYTSYSYTANSKSECLTYDSKADKSSSVLNMFKVSSLRSCWSYCNLAGVCSTFTFHSFTKKCVMFSKYLPSTVEKKNKNLTTGHLTCLECLGGVNEVVNKSGSGVLIIHEYMLKCLAIDLKQIVANDTQGFRLRWKACAKSDRWVFITTENVYLIWGRKLNLVRISSAKDPNSNLEWKIMKNNKTKTEMTQVFLTIKSNSTSQLFLLEKSRLSLDSCAFQVYGPHYKHGKMEGEYKSNLYTSSLISQNNLEKVFIHLQPPDQQNTCTSSEFFTKNSKVLNENKVPFFLPGSSVRIVCNEGYGIKGINYTQQQEVVCDKKDRPKRCSLITWNEKNAISLNWETPLVIVVTLVIITILFITFLPSKTLCRHNIHRKKQRAPLQNTAAAQETKITGQ